MTWTVREPLVPQLYALGDAGQAVPCLFILTEQLG